MNIVSKRAKIRINRSTSSNYFRTSYMFFGISSIRIRCNNSSSMRIRPRIQIRPRTSNKTSMRWFKSSKIKDIKNYKVRVIPSSIITTWTSSINKIAKTIILWTRFLRSLNCRRICWWRCSKARLVSPTWTIIPANSNLLICQPFSSWIFRTWYKSQKIISRWPYIKPIPT